MRKKIAKPDERFQLTFSDEIVVERPVVDYLRDQSVQQRSVEARQLALDGFRLVSQLMQQQEHQDFDATMIELSIALGLDGNEIRKYLGLPACIMQQRIDIKDIVKLPRATRNLSVSAGLSDAEFTRNAVIPDGKMNELIPKEGGGTSKPLTALEEEAAINLINKEEVSDAFENDLKNLISW